MPPAPTATRRLPVHLLAVGMVWLVTATALLVVVPGGARADISGETTRSASDVRGDTSNIRADARSVYVRTGNRYTTELRWYASPQPANAVIAQVYFPGRRGGATWQVYAEWRGSWKAAIYKVGDSTRRCVANASWIDSKRGVRVQFAPGCVGRATPASVSGQSYAQLEYGNYVDKVNR